MFDENKNQASVWNLSTCWEASENSSHVEHDFTNNSHLTGKQQKMARFLTKSSTGWKLGWIFLKFPSGRWRRTLPPLTDWIWMKLWPGGSHGVWAMPRVVFIFSSLLHRWLLLDSSSSILSSADRSCRVKRGQTWVRWSPFKGAHLWLASEARFLPLSAVCVSLPSARPPLSLRSPLQICNASPDPPAWSPGQKVTLETTDESKQNELWPSLTFCSKAVASCSTFTSLNFRSFICRLESPEEE